MKLLSVEDKAFRKYGKVIEGIECQDILQAMSQINAPEDVAYEPLVECLQSCQSTAAIAHSLYGDMPIQVGYCNGYNHTLNAFEYHRDSEINIAVTDLILILGKEQDVEDDFTYDTKKAEAFVVPAGTMIEVYATTLHYAPCSIGDKAFKCVVVLPKGTNTQLEVDEAYTKEDALLFAKNKWLIAHPQSGLDREGAFIGLKGENLTV